MIRSTIYFILQYYDYDYVTLCVLKVHDAQAIMPFMNTSDDFHWIQFNGKTHCAFIVNSIVCCLKASIEYAFCCHEKPISRLLNWIFKKKKSLSITLLMACDVQNLFHISHVSVVKTSDLNRCFQYFACCQLSIFFVHTFSIFIPNNRNS